MRPTGVHAPHVIESGCADIERRERVGVNDDLTLVYTPGGTRTHVLPPLGSPNLAGQDALCGRSAWPALWSGTGTQEEYERAREQPLCSSCRAVLIHREGHVG